VIIIPTRGIDGIYTPVGKYRPETDRQKKSGQKKPLKKPLSTLPSVHVSEQSGRRAVADVRGNGDKNDMLHYLSRNYEASVAVVNLSVSFYMLSASVKRS
jgi:hypothetical protein